MKCFDSLCLQTLHGYPKKTHYLCRFNENGMIRRKKEVKLERGLTSPLPVMEHFYTLQGEGAWVGTPAYFVRLAGCDVGCHWCDVKDSWHPDTYPKMSCEAITAAALASGTERVVITGGEPTVYDLTLLAETLRREGLIVHMETAGPHPLRGEIDWICLSPKKFLQPQQEIYEKAHELKIIIYNDHDFVWAEMQAAKCGEHTQLFLQVEWSKRDILTEKIIAYVRENPRWRLSIQTHKYLDIP